MPHSFWFLAIDFVRPWNKGTPMSEILNCAFNRLSENASTPSVQYLRLWLDEPNIIVWANSLLATLNSRRALRNRSRIEDTELEEASGRVGHHTGTSLDISPFPNSTNSRARRSRAVRMPENGNIRETDHNSVQHEAVSVHFEHTSRSTDASPPNVHVSSRIDTKYWLCSADYRLFVRCTTKSQKTLLTISWIYTKMIVIGASRATRFHSKFSRSSYLPRYYFKMFCTPSFRPVGLWRCLANLSDSRLVYNKTP